TFLGVNEDDGLTWRLQWVADAQTRPVGFGANNPAAAVDADGNVYVAWTGADWQHWVARSRDKGFTWSEPMLVAPDVRSTTFPLLMAGSAGRVATAFLGTRDTDLGPDLAPPEARWHLFAAFSDDAGATAPTWRVVQLTPDSDPVMMGCIGRHGHTCPNENLLDFNGIALTPDGRVVISYTDGCAACTLQSDSTSSAGWVAVQVAGDALR
ncbi:MAG TPA: sialidase family protein, partial [Chloroflexota bacterium]|nr:sialidase family protein [Chloroflexota bacterium]